MTVAIRLLVVTACGGQPASPSGSTPQAEIAPRGGVPHGEPIVLVASTHAGDAARTVVVAVLDAASGLEAIRLNSDAMFEAFDKVCAEL